MKEKILFFGTLRSKKVLKNVLLENLENFNFKECYIKSAKLKKVVNETYPALFYTNNPLDIVEAVIIEYLEESHLKKILFFESWEYKIENIEVYVDNKKILVKYLKESKKTLISDEDWNYYQWKKKNESFDAECARLWMKLYFKYSNPSEAEHLWLEIVEKAKKNIF